MSFRITRHIKAQLPIERELFLSILGGLGSGVATTTAIVIGFVISERGTQVATTVAYIAVIAQAFNSAAARYTGLRASEEIDDLSEEDKVGPFVNALIQFVTHSAAAFVPMLPLFHFTGTFQIVSVSILLSYAMLLVIGLFQGMFLRVQAKQNMIELLVIGTLIIAVGSFAGFLLR